MANGYINPQLAAVLAAQLKMGLPPQQQDPSQPPANPQPVPSAALPPIASLVDTQPFDSLNDGINSVGRPSDLQAQSDNAMQGVNSGIKQAGHDKELSKLMRQGKGEALLALGASLLSAPTFGQGMSTGLANYVKTLREARDRVRPKHESVGDGSFERVTDPVDDSVSYERTPYADYQEDKYKTAANTKVDVATIQADGKIGVADINNTGAMDRTKFMWNAKGNIASLDRDARIGIAKARNDTSLAVAKVRAQNGGKPNASIENQITGLSDDVVLINDSLTRAAPVMEAIQKGTLRFDPLHNGLNTLKNLGVLPSDDTSRAYGQYTTLRESLRGAYLLAFKGVQTEGDAQRAFDAIFPSQGDTSTVKNALEIVVNRIQNQLSVKQSRLSTLGSYRDPAAPEPSAAPTTPTISWQRVH